MAYHFAAGIDAVAAAHVVEDAQHTIGVDEEAPLTRHKAGHLCRAVQRITAAETKPMLATWRIEIEQRAAVEQERAVVFGPADLTSGIDGARTALTIRKWLRAAPIQYGLITRI